MNNTKTKSFTSASDVQVKVSNDYSKFAILGGNRTIDSGNVKKIMYSMERLFVPVPIIVNEKFEIIDGQHRFQACVNLELPIYYIQKEGLTLQDVILLNHDQKKWSIQDYINAYAERGNENFIKLVQLQNHSDYVKLGLWEILSIVMDKYRRIGGSDFKRKLEEGTLKLDVTSVHHKDLYRLATIKEVLKSNKSLKDDVTFTFIKLLKDNVFDEDHFFAKLRILDQEKAFFIGVENGLYWVSGSPLIHTKVREKWNDLFPDNQVSIDG